MDMDLYEDVDSIEPFNAGGLSTRFIKSSNNEQFKIPRLPTYSSRPALNNENVTSSITKPATASIAMRQVARLTNDYAANNNNSSSASHSTSTVLPEVENSTPVGLIWRDQRKKIILAVSVAVTVALLAAAIAVNTVISRQRSASPKSATVAMTTTSAALEPMRTPSTPSTTSSNIISAVAAVKPKLQATSCGRPDVTLYSTQPTWNDAETFLDSGNLSTIVVQMHTTGCPCTNYQGGCIDGLQATYGSVKGSRFGQGQGQQYDISLAADGVITGVYVGFATLDYIISVGEGLCYLQFNSTKRSYGPYDVGCRGTVTSYYSLPSGLAYISGNGGWCISGLTFYHYK